MPEHCTLVNPLCPDDLCQLPYGHQGSAAGVHLLETMAYPGKLIGFPVAPRGTRRVDLIEMGCEIQDDKDDPFWIGEGKVAQSYAPLFSDPS